MITRIHKKKHFSVFPNNKMTLYVQFFGKQTNSRKAKTEKKTTWPKTIESQKINAPIQNL